MTDNTGIDLDPINFFEVIPFRTDETSLTFTGTLVNVDSMSREGETKTVDNTVFVGLGPWLKFAGYSHTAAGYSGS